LNYILQEAIDFKSSESDDHICIRKGICSQLDAIREELTTIDPRPFEAQLSSNGLPQFFQKAHLALIPLMGYFTVVPKSHEYFSYFENILDEL